MDPITQIETVGAGITFLRLMAILLACACIPTIFGYIIAPLLRKHKAEDKYEIR